MLTIKTQICLLVYYILIASDTFFLTLIHFTLIVLAFLSATPNDLQKETKNRV